MTDSQREIIDKIEADRRKREEEELLLLLLLIDDGAHTDDAATSIRSALSTRGVGVMAETMAEAHIDGAAIHADVHTLARIDAGRADLIRQYTPQAQATAQAMADAIKTAIDEYKPTAEQPANDIIREALKKAGYTAEHPRNLKIGIERNVVSAGNAGLVAGGIASVTRTGGAPKKPPGLRHVSVIDVRTTDICLPRDGLQLACNHPYWRENWPSLHPRCRSIIFPLVGDYDAAESIRNFLRPDPGYGIAPAAVIESLTNWQLV